VWYDALTAYMSGIGFVDGEHDGPDFRFWPADIHAMGKEIIRFHAVYWPAFLMAAEMPLPKQIVAHGWLLFEQEKMSKSKGNVAYPEPIVKVLGNDALRYYLMREVVFGQDGNFSRDALITRYNADLANGLGNLASRVVSMVNQYSSGLISVDSSGPHTTLQEEPARRLPEIRLQIVTNYEKFNFFSSLELIWKWIAQIDLYLTEGEPWKIGALFKGRDETWTIPDSWERYRSLSSPLTKQQALDQILYRAAESLRCVAVLAHPVIPDATQKIWEQLGQLGKIADQRIDQLQWGGLKPGTKIGKPEAVFPRVDKKEAMERIEAMENEIRNPGSTAPAATGTPAAGAASSSGPGAAAAAAAAPGAKITIDDFAKVELRVGVVKSAEKVQGADRLLKVMVDIGDEVRQVLAGIALAYAPEELVGRKVVVVANLAPRKMRGQESNGMLLAASDGADGKPVLVTFAEEIPAGAKVK